MRLSHVPLHAFLVVKLHVAIFAFYLAVFRLFLAEQAQQNIVKRAV
jgi:hypothetical protein